MKRKINVWCTRLLNLIGLKERYILCRPLHRDCFIWDTWAQKTVGTFPSVEEARSEVRRLRRETFRFCRN